MNLPRSTYPPLNMHFAIQFCNSDFDDEIYFQSVQGLKVRICENEKGNGTYVKFDNLILRRAYQPESKMVKWCMDAINHNKKRPLNLAVHLLNTKHKPLSSWHIFSALPIAWGIDELHAQESKILIETIELDYDYFEIVNPDSKSSRKEVYEK